MVQLMNTGLTLCHFLYFDCQHLFVSCHLQWHRLYSTEHDGRSFNRLAWSLMGYRGPTLILTQSTSGNVIGAYVDSTTTLWKDSNERYGSLVHDTDHSSWVGQLHPEFKIYHPLESRIKRAKEDNSSKTADTKFKDKDSTAFIYFHCKDHENPHYPVDHGLLQGLGLGGSGDVQRGNTHQFRLYVASSLDEIEASPWDDMFEAGSLISQQEEKEGIYSSLALDMLEIWAVGATTEILQDGLQHRATRQQQKESALQKARGLTDKTALAHDLQSGLIPNTLFQHQEATRGRHDFYVDDEHEGAYKVDRA
jgi:TLD